MLSKHVNTWSTPPKSNLPPKAPLVRSQRLDEALALAGEPWTPEQILFLIWYRVTTRLAHEGIATIFNRTFRPTRPILRWDVRDVLKRLEDRYRSNGDTWGSFPRPPKPTRPGWNACDHGYDCEVVMRKTRTKHDWKLGGMGTNMWPGSLEALLTCPRTHRARTKRQEEAVAKRRRSMSWQAWTKGITDELWNELVDAHQRTVCWLLEMVPPLIGAFLVGGFSYTAINWFYTPLAKQSDNMVAWSTFCHTSYGLPMTIALICTAQQAIKEVMPDFARKAREREVLKTGGVATTKARVPSYLELFLRLAIGLGVALWFCSQFGLIDEWKAAKHPDQEIDFGDFEESWESIKQRSVGLLQSATAWWPYATGVPEVPGWTPATTSAASSEASLPVWSTNSRGIRINR